MDKFTKYALLTMLIIVSLMLISAYVGGVVLKGNNQGTDSKVNKEAGQHTTSWFGFEFTADAWGQMGEYIGFSLAGVAGGLIVGYCLPTLLDKSNDAPRRDN